MKSFFILFCVTLWRLCFGTYGEYGQISTKYIAVSNILKKIDRSSTVSCYLKCLQNTKCFEAAVSTDQNNDCFLLKDYRNEINDVEKRIKMNVISKVCPTDVCLAKSKEKSCQPGFFGSNCEKDGAFAVRFVKSTTEIPVLRKELLAPLTEVSVSFWMKMTDPPTRTQTVFLLSKVQPRKHCDDFGLLYGTSGSYLARFPKHSFKLHYQEPLDNQWTHVVMTLDGNKSLMKFYINAQEKSKIQNSKIIPLHSSNSKQFIQLALGNDADEGSNNRCVVNEVNQGIGGSITNFFLWKRILTSKEIEAAYENKPPYFDALVTWDEFQSTVTGKEALLTDYPFKT